MIIMKCKDVLRGTFSRQGGGGSGGGGRVTWEDLSMEQSFMREDNFH